MIETVRRIARNVKRWQNGDMCLRWTAAGMLEAEQQFRKIIGFNDLAKLAITVERDVAAKRAAAFTSQPLNDSPITAPEVAGYVIEGHVPADVIQKIRADAEANATAER